MIGRLTSLLLIAGYLSAADFQNGQAARAVLGQPSFSSREAGITPIALSVTKGRLYAADASNRLLSFDLTKIPGPKDKASEGSAAGSCPVCAVAPISSIEQSVMPGIAGISSFGKTVVIAEPTRHRVLIWRDVTAQRGQQPDLVLGESAGESVISAATLIDPVAVAFDGKRLFVADTALHRVLVWNTLPASNSQPADFVLGQPDFTSLRGNEATGADTIRVPTALASDGTNLFVGDSADHRILVFTLGDLTLSAGSVVNSASLIPGPFAPGTLITIKLGGLTKTALSAEDHASQAAIKKLAGVEAYLNGIAIPLLSVSPTGLEAQIPYDLANASSVSLYIRSDRAGEPMAISTATALKLVPAAPGVYAFTGEEPRTGLLLHSNLNQLNAPPSPVTLESPARPGDELTVWAAGLGLVNDAGNELRAIAGIPFSGPAASVLSPLTATVAGRPVEVVSAGLPSGAVGIYEVRVVLPPDLPSDANTELVISQNGYESNTVTFPVAAANP